MSEEALGEILTIKTTGTYTDDTSSAAININMSDIYSHLIKVCGVEVKNYNSDLIYDINSMERYLKGGIKRWRESNSYNKNDEFQSISFLLGFRESGVDSREFINNSDNREYKSIWQVTFKYYEKNGKIEAILEKVKPR